MGYDISAVLIAAVIVIAIFKDGKVSGNGEITMLVIASMILGSISAIQNLLQMPINWLIEFLVSLISS